MVEHVNLADNNLLPTLRGKSSRWYHSDVQYFCTTLLILAM